MRSESTWVETDLTSQKEGGKKVLRLGSSSTFTEPFQFVKAVAYFLIFYR